jgi:hypothetical protein
VLFLLFRANYFYLNNFEVSCRRQGPVAELLTQWKANIGCFDGRGSELLCEAVARQEDIFFLIYRRFYMFKPLCMHHQYKTAFCLNNNWNDVDSVEIVEFRNIHLSSPNSLFYLLHLVLFQRIKSIFLQW